MVDPAPAPAPVPDLLVLANADASHRASELKDRLGAAAYPVGALVEGATADGFVTTIEVDGEVSEPLSQRRYRLHPAGWTVIRPT